MPECPGAQWISVAMPWARRFRALLLIHLASRCPGPGSSCESYSLTELDTEDGEILEEEVATGKAMDEGKEEEETILNDDIECSSQFTENVSPRSD